MIALSKRNKEVVASSNVLKKELGKSRSEVEGLVHERARLEDRLRHLELERKLRPRSHKNRSISLSLTSRACRDVMTNSQTKKENYELSASTPMSYKLMKEFLDH